MLRIKLAVLTALFSLQLLALLALPTVTFAAEVDGPVPTSSGIVLNQTGDLEGKITTLTDSLTTLGRPIAILALVLAVLSVIAAPALPDWSRENQGMIRKVLGAALFLGLVPDMVNFVLG